MAGQPGKIADELRRRVVVAAAEFEGARFQVTLEGDAGERVLHGAAVVRPDRRS